MKDVKYETEMILNEYVRHLDERFETMVSSIKRITGKKDLIQYLRKALEADEIEFKDEKPVRKEEHHAEFNAIVMSKKELIIACGSGGFVILVVWLASFVTLYLFMKQRRSVTLTPRAVRFSKLPDSPRNNQRQPRLQRSERVFFDLNAAETLV
jgi:hypothetical protein